MHSRRLAIIVELYFMNYLSIVLGKGILRQMGEKCWDHPENRTDNPEAIDILEQVQPAEGIHKADARIPTLSL